MTNAPASSRYNPKSMHGENDGIFVKGMNYGCAGCIWMFVGALVLGFVVVFLGIFALGILGVTAA